MSVKKIFTWIYLLCKHILKMPVIFILLLIIPAVTLTFRLLPGSASQTYIYAGIYFESNDDPATIQLKTMLLSSGESSFSFVEYADHDVLENDVMSGKLECAYIFTDKFSKALSDGKYKNSVEVIKSPSTIMLNAINEIVFAAIVRNICMKPTRHTAQEAKPSTLTYAPLTTFHLTMNRINPQP